VTSTRRSAYVPALSAKRRRCSVCRRDLEPTRSQRQCRPCHAAYMRLWRAQQRQNLDAARQLSAQLAGVLG
jgi:hypothetical protein